MPTHHAPVPPSTWLTTGCSAGALCTWPRQADRDEGRRSGGLTTAEREERAQRRRENRLLRADRALLRNAAAGSRVAPPRFPVPDVGAGRPVCDERRGSLAPPNPTVGRCRRDDRVSGSLTVRAQPLRVRDAIMAAPASR